MCQSRYGHMLVVRTNYNMNYFFAHWVIIYQNLAFLFPFSVCSIYIITITIRGKNIAIKLLGLKQ